MREESSAAQERKEGERVHDCVGTDHRRFDIDWGMRRLLKFTQGQSKGIVLLQKRVAMDKNECVPIDGTLGREQICDMDARKVREAHSLC